MAAKPKAKTGAQRQKAYAATGRPVACVIRDPAAIAALERLVAKLGGVTAAVTHALRTAGA